MIHSVTHLALRFTSSLQRESASAGILWSGRQPVEDGWMERRMERWKENSKKERERFGVAMTEVKKKKRVRGCPPPHHCSYTSIPLPGPKPLHDSFWNPSSLNQIFHSHRSSFINFSLWMSLLSPPHPLTLPPPRTSPRFCVEVHSPAAECQTAIY